MNFLPSFMKDFTLDKDTSTMICSICGTVLSLILNFSPFNVIFKMFKNEVTYESLPESLMIFSIFSGELLTIYWIKNKLLIQTVGYVISTCSSILVSFFYLYFRTDKRIIYFLLGIFLVLNLVVEIAYIFGVLILDTNIILQIAVVVNIIRYASPGQKILEVIRTGKYQLIPIATTFAGAINSSFWFSYGIFTWTTIGVPDGFGLVFSAIQFYLYFHYKNKKNKNIDLENQEELKQIDN